LEDDNLFITEFETFVESTIVSTWKNLDNTKKRLVYTKIQEHIQKQIEQFEKQSHETQFQEETYHDPHLTLLSSFQNNNNNEINDNNNKNHLDNNLVMEKFTEKNKDKILSRYEKEDDHDSDYEDENCWTKEAKSRLLFDRIKKAVEGSKYEPNIMFEELQEHISYEKINQVDDPIMLDFSNKIAHNEETIQTCTKICKISKSYSYRKFT